MSLKSLFARLFLTCIGALVLSHIVLAALFALLFQDSLASAHLNLACLEAGQ